MGDTAIQWTGKTWNPGFQIGWDSINGKRKGCAWSDNPFVWSLDFRKL